MKKLLGFLVLGAVVFACNSTPETEGTSSSKNENAKTVAEAKPEIDGAKIYKQYCVTCHGLYGDMGASGAHDLTKSELTVDERVNVITNGRNTMVGFKSLLNEEKIKAVAAYTLKLKKDEEEGAK